MLNAKAILTISVLCGAVLFYKDSILNTARGIRNNNPGNIERGTDAWQGMSEDQSSDERFIVFDGPEWGIRAIARILMSYNRRGVDTLQEVLATWAPPSENNTNAYIASVSQQTGIVPDRVLSPSDYPAVIAALIRHENGSNPYSDELINRGIALA